MARRIAPTFLPTDADEFRRGGLWQDRLLSSYLTELAATEPNKVMVIDGARQYTAAQVDAWASVMAGFLRGLGIQQGETVTFVLPNWIETVVLCQAIMKLGAVTNPVVPIYREREVTFILKESGSAVFVVPGIFRGFDYVAMARRLREAVPSLRHIVAVGPHEPADDIRSLPDFNAGQPQSPIAAVPGSADDPTLLLYTSGTTANPKGAIHSHNTLNAELAHMIEWFQWTSEDSVLMPSPLTHITGYLYGVLQPFMLRAPVVLLDIWDPEKALDLILKFGCRYTIGATPFLRDLLGAIHARGLSSKDVPLRSFPCGGADVPPALIEEANRFGLQSGRVYGSTEFPTFSSYALDSPIEVRAYSDGVPQSGQGKVLNDDDVECKVGEPGELVLKGPERFLGYLDESLNADSFTPDGWFRTGDLVALRADGAIEVKGRKKDIIIRGGEKISAKEVEDLLFKHPLVRGVAVVSMPDPRMTERACAYIVPTDPANPPTLDGLAEFLGKEQVAKQKYPERIEIVAALPMTASGKIQKYLLRQDIRSKLAEGR